MAYFTIETLRSRMGEADFLGLVDTDGDGLLGIEEQARVQRIINEASSEIDSYVGTRYSVPLAPENITDAFLGKVCDCIVYHLGPTGDLASDLKTRKYKDACSWAEKVGCGKAQLGSTATEPAQRLASATVSHPESVSGIVSSSANAFSITNMQGLG